jgi:sugar transferase (PEP-CTERM/EpsH1 system associated)
MSERRQQELSSAPLIAHVIFRLDVGGLENGLVNLINRMPEDRFRHAIICIDRSTEFRRRIRRDDVEIFDIRKRPGRDLRASWRLYQVLRQLRPHIVHTRNLGALDALLPAICAGVRHRIHGEHGWDVDDLQGTSRKNRLLRKLHAPMISSYVTVSRDLKDYLMQKIGINEQRIRHICNGVDTDRFTVPNADNPGADILRSVFGDDVCVIGTVGRVEPVKDPFNLAAAFKRLIANGPECAHARLVCIGDGELHAQLVQKLEEDGLLQYVWLPGRRDDVAELMGGFDVFVQASLAEGISNTVLEAMASGLPIIATDVGGNPELVRQDSNGLIVPAADRTALFEAMRRYVSDRPLREAHGRASRQRALDEFSIDRMVRDYTELYEQTLA